MGGVGEGPDGGHPGLVVAHGKRIEGDDGGQPETKRERWLRRRLIWGREGARSQLGPSPRSEGEESAEAGMGRGQGKPVLDARQIRSRCTLTGRGSAGAMSPTPIRMWVLRAAGQSHAARRRPTRARRGPARDRCLLRALQLAPPPANPRPHRLRPILVAGQSQRRTARRARPSEPVAVHVLASPACASASAPVSCPSPLALACQCPPRIRSGRITLPAPVLSNGTPARTEGAPSFSLSPAACTPQLLRPARGGESPRPKPPVHHVHPRPIARSHTPRAAVQLRNRTQARGDTPDGRPRMTSVRYVCTAQKPLQRPIVAVGTPFGGQS